MLPGELSAYERWELPNLGDNNPIPSRSVAKAEKIKPLTAEDIEKIRQQAYDAGFEEGRVAGVESGRLEGVDIGKKEGLEQGLQQGLSDGQAEINNQVSHLSGLCAQLVEPLAQQQKLVEQAILNVAMAVSRAVVHRELRVDSSTILAALPCVLKDLPKADNGFILTLNPADQDVVQSALGKLGSNIELKLDPSMTVGGCFLKTSSQLVDYTIEKRFQKTVQVMLNNAAQNDRESDTREVPVSIGSLSDYSAETLDEVDLSEVEQSKEKVVGVDEPAFPEADMAEDPNSMIEESLTVPLDTDTSDVDAAGTSSMVENDNNDND